MHACGHDTHTSMLVGAARLLSARRADIAGRVLFMFQPGEEGDHGARFMLEEGLLDLGPRADGSASPVTGAFAMHITLGAADGFVSYRGGSIMASADTMFITVTGRGGHASEPHRALDPIPIACEIVQALQTMITRRIDVFDPARRHRRQDHRRHDEQHHPRDRRDRGHHPHRQRAHQARRSTTASAASPKASPRRTTPRSGRGSRRRLPGDGQRQGPGRCSPLDLADELVGADKTIRLPNPIMGAEDFSYVCSEVPGAMMFLGGTHTDRDLATAAPNHSNRVVFDEEAMVTGTAMYAAMALNHLRPETLSGSQSAAR